MATKTNASAGVQSAPATHHAAAVLAELRRAGKPIILSVNQTSFVVEDEGSYRQLVTLIDRLETIGGIREALQDVEAGRTLSLEEFKAEAQQKHGLPG